MSTATPSWSDNVALAGTLATPQTLAHGNKVKGTLDLRGKFGGYLTVRLGRLGTNAPFSPILVQVRRVGSAAGQGGASLALLGSNSSGVASTVTSDSNSGQSLIVVANTTSFNVGNRLHQDIDPNRNGGYGFYTPAQTLLDSSSRITRWSRRR